MEMPDGPLSLSTSTEVARALSQRAKTLRLQRAWTQLTLSRRAGVTLASYRRFEGTGKASLDLVLRVAHALACLDDFEGVLRPPVASTMEELVARDASHTPPRRRGVR